MDPDPGPGGPKTATLLLRYARKLEEKETRVKI
jgi:hypothetical protein